MLIKMNLKSQSIVFEDKGYLSGNHLVQTFHVLPKCMQVISRQKNTSQI